MALNNGMLLGLALAACGAALLLAGVLQNRRPRDLTAAVPLTSWHFKAFIGGGFLFIAINILFQSARG